MTLSDHICFGLAVAVTSTVWATPTIRGLGTLPGGTSSAAGALSIDGRVVVGWADDGGGSQRAVRWSAGTGLVALPMPAGYDSAHAAGVSGAGTIIIGSALDSTGTFPEAAFRWSATDGVQLLGGMPAEMGCSASGINHDGSVIVGTGQLDGGQQAYRALKWTAPGQVVGLPHVSIGHSAASAVSGDGGIVVGASDVLYGAPYGYVSHPARWNTLVADIGLPTGAIRGGASAVSSNGRYACGYYDLPNSNTHAFKWSTTGGLVDIIPPSNTHYHNPTGISNDGEVIVGWVSPFDADTYAFIRLPGGETVDLNAYLPTRGLDLAGWHLSAAYAITPDGNFIVGEGVHNGVNEGWVLELTLDEDGDGLLDDWETLGIPYTDSNGVSQRYIIDANGDGVSDADPRHKDLFVELDLMQGMSFSLGTRNLVAATFADAPVSNPDGVPGITLHTALDETATTRLYVWTSSNGCMPNTFDTYEAQFFGSVAERASPDHAAILEAKRKAWRHCIGADQCSAGVGGCGYLSGDAFVMFLGTVRATNAGEDKAAVFLHELGHNLGLSHGGGDEINGKVNYPSIMNYPLLYRCNWNDSFYALDFSRAEAGAFPLLEEAALDETGGIGAAGGRYADYYMPFGYDVEFAGVIIGRDFDFIRLNGTPTDLGCTTCPSAGLGLVRDGVISTGALQDLNWLPGGPDELSLPGAASAGETLVPFDDWGHIRLRLKASLEDAAPAPVPSHELTSEARDYIDSLLTVPEGVCAADIGRQGGIAGRDGALNNNDFVVYIDWFFTGDPRADRGRVGGIAGRDGEFDNNDFIVFIDQFFAGC